MRKYAIWIAVLAMIVMSACTGANAAVSETTDVNDEADVVQEVQITATATQIALVADAIDDAEAFDDRDDAGAIEATPTPQSNGLQPGESRAIALATDVAMQPDLEEKMTFDDAPVTLQFSEFYDGYDLRTGLILSDKLQSLDGEQVIIEGYMAPPLKPALDWFVLTRVRLAICPFCSTDADWPNDIALAYMPDGETVLANEYPLRVTGQLEVGVSTDAETGMVSMVRVYVEDIEEIR